jgi:hypothetical protein
VILTKNDEMAEANDAGSRDRYLDDSMIINGLDMNYLGVYSVWNNDLGMLFGFSVL